MLYRTKFKDSEVEMPLGDRLTVRQHQIYEWIFAYTMKHGFQPGFREIMGEFDIRSCHGISVALDSMAKKGWLATGFTNAKAIKFIRCPDGTPFKGFQLKD